MARCGACGVEFEAAKQEACPSCGAPRPRPARRAPPVAPQSPAPPSGRAAQRPSTGAPSHASEYIRLSAQRGAPGMPAPLGDPAAGDDVGTKRRGPSVVPTVVASIGFGVVVFAVGVFAIDDFASVSRRLTISDGLTVALYAVVALLVRSRLARGDVRPDFAEGRDAQAIGIGIATGLGGGVFIVAANSLVSGKLSSDIHLVGVLYERKWLHVGIAIVIAVIAAPLVEELLFRGLFVESLRSRGKAGAVLAGSVAFSLWHLNPSALRYYILMGFFLGLLYWRFGINGSITAHAVFNATLIVFAFAVVSGSPEPVTAGGVTVAMPAGWFEVGDDVIGAEQLPAGAAVDIAVQSPTGSAFVVEHIDGQGALSLAALGANLPPGSSGAQRVRVANGDGLRFSLDNPDGEGVFDTVMTGRGNRVFIITFISAGSAQASKHHEQMLASLLLPA